MEINETRIRYLEAIQRVVDRLSNISFILKGWAVSLVAGLMALAASGSNQGFVLIAYVCKSMAKVLPGRIPVMFGDFSYFWIGERGKRVMKRLVERYADRGQVAFIMSERIDAKLVLPEAVKLLKVSGTPAETIED